MATYYKVNVKRLPLSLVWSWGNPLVFCVFAIRRLLPGSWVHPGLVPGEPRIIPLEEDTAPADLVAALQEPSTQLVADALVPITHYQVPAVGLGRGLCRAFISTDGRIAALALTNGPGMRGGGGVTAMSLLPSGQLIATSSMRLRLPTVPWVSAVRMPGQGAREVIHAHRARITGHDVKVLEAESVLDLILDQQRRSIEYYSAEGLYAPATQQDIDRALASGRDV